MLLWLQAQVHWMPTEAERHTWKSQDVTSMSEALRKKVTAVASRSAKTTKGVVLMVGY